MKYLKILRGAVLGSHFNALDVVVFAVLDCHYNYTGFLIGWFIWTCISFPLKRFYNLKVLSNEQKATS